MAFRKVFLLVIAIHFLSALEIEDPEKTNGGNYNNVNEVQNYKKEKREVEAKYEENEKKIKRSVEETDIENDEDEEKNDENQGDEVVKKNDIERDEDEIQNGKNQDNEEEGRKGYTFTDRYGNEKDIPSVGSIRDIIEMKIAKIKEAGQLTRAFLFGV